MFDRDEIVHLSSVSLLMKSGKINHLLLSKIGLLGDIHQHRGVIILHSTWAGVSAIERREGQSKQRRLAVRLVCASAAPWAYQLMADGGVLPRALNLARGRLLRIGVVAICDEAHGLSRRHLIGDRRRRRRGLREAHLPLSELVILDTRCRAAGGGGS